MIQQVVGSIPVSGLIFLVCLGYFICTKVFSKPDFISKTPFTLWFFDLVVWPVGIFAGFTLFNEILRLTLGPEVLVKSLQLQSLTLYITFSWLAARGVDLIFLRWYVFHRTGFTTPALLRGLNYAVFVVAGLSLFLLGIGYPITGFLVSTGLVAGILGLALQSTLNDLFSGIALSVDRPFQIGDWVQLEDKTVGQVIDLTWRSTRIKTFSSTLLSVPNSLMAKSAIVNLDRPEKAYAVWYKIGVSTEIDPRLVVTVMSAAVGNCKHILRKPNPTVRLIDASGAPYIYMVWVHYASYLNHFHGQEQLHMDINRSLKAAGISTIGELQEVRYSRSAPINPHSPSIADTLRSLDIFSELKEQEIEHIAKASEYILVNEDTVLLEEGANSNQVHVVVNGALESSITLKNGQQALAEQLDVGDSFGWSTIVTDEKAIMTVKATADSLVLVIDAECLRPILNEHDELRQRFFNLVTERVKRLSNIRHDSFGKKKPLSTTELRRRLERFIAGG